MGFKEVNRRERCYICKKASWCSVSICGEFLICRREQHYSAKVKNDKNGENYFVYETRKVEK